MQRVVAYAGAAVLLLDSLGSIASMRLGFSYSSLSPLSYLIYALAGFAAGRLAGPRAGMLVGALTAFIEATAGWALSWQLGPGRPPMGYDGIMPIAVVVVTVTLGGAFIGFLAGSIAQIGRTPKRAAS